MTITRHRMGLFLAIFAMFAMITAFNAQTSLAMDSRSMAPTAVVLER